MAQEQGVRNIWWWLTVLVVAAVALIVVIQWPTGPDEPGEQPGSAPAIDEGVDEDDTEEFEPPTDRPPGTAPADPRRPATVPSESSHQTEEPTGEGDVEAAEAYGLEASSDGADSETPPVDQGETDEADETGDESDETDRRARRVPAHLRSGIGDDDEEESAIGDDDAEDETEDGERTSSQRIDGGLASDDEESAVDDESAEWADGEGNDDDFEGQPDDEALEGSDPPEGLVAEGDDEDWDEELDDEWDEELDEDLDDEWEDVAEETAEEEPEAVDDVDGEPRDLAGDDARTAETGDIGGTQRNRVGEEWSQESPGQPEESIQEPAPDAEPAPVEQARDDYRDVLDEQGAVGPSNAAAYTAMATRQLADSLYLLSAGTTLPERDAAAQRDDIVDAIDEDDVDETDSGDEPGGSGEPSDDGDDDVGDDDAADGDELGEEWTVWLDAADWLRLIQMREYPELAVLVDDVEVAAEAIDPDRPEEEQIDELVDFYEAVEVVLEAMATESEIRSEGT